MSRRRLIGGGLTIRTGVLLWLDGADTRTITESSGSVSQWDDKSGNGNNITQGTGSAQPTTNATTQNGYNVIDFDGGDSLDFPSELYSLANGDYTAFVVCKRDSEDASIDFIIGGQESTSTRVALAYNDTAGEVLWRSNTGTSGGVSNSGNTNTNFQVMTAILSGTTQSLSINGGTASTNTSGAYESGIDSLLLGGRASGNNLIGSIAEVVIYNRALSAGEITLIESYLSNKWGV